MSPLPHQITSSPYEMTNTATTPAVRPFSIHDGSKVVTDSAQRKLDRKRANARIRQQRCRARKRARAIQDEETSLENKKICLNVLRPKQSLPPLEKPEEVSSSPSPIKPKVPEMQPVAPARYWQHPPPPPAYRKPLTKNIHKLAKVPASIASANAIKEQATQGSAPYHHGAAAAYYAHHHHHAWYSHHYGAWSQAAAAAYYGHHMQAPHVHAGYHQHHHHVHSHPGSHPGVPQTGLAPKLPPKSPLQRVSPAREEDPKPQPTEVSTPYHAVEAIFKSPMRPFADVVSTPVPKEKRGDASTPVTGLLPRLWSTVTKPTPAGYVARSPWSDNLPSPSLMTHTPAPNADWNLTNLGFHDTPCLPTTTPMKMSSDMDSTWHSSPTVA